METAVIERVKMSEFFNCLSWFRKEASAGVGDDPLKSHLAFPLNFMKDLLK